MAEAPSEKLELNFVTAEIKIIAIARSGYRLLLVEGDSVISSIGWTTVIVGYRHSFRTLQRSSLFVSVDHIYLFTSQFSIRTFKRILVLNISFHILYFVNFF